MAGAQGQSTVREVASLLTSGAVWARVLRVLLMFSLVFWLTLRVERPQAYGAEPGEGSIYDVEIKPDTIGPVGAGQSVDLWAVGKWDETVVTQEAYDETGQAVNVRSRSRHSLTTLILCLICSPDSISSTIAIA